MLTARFPMMQLISCLESIDVERYQALICPAVLRERYFLALAEPFGAPHSTSPSVVHVASWRASTTADTRAAPSRQTKRHLSPPHVSPSHAPVSTNLRTQAPLALVSNSVRSASMPMDPALLCLSDTFRRHSYFSAQAALFGTTPLEHYSQSNRST